MISLAESTFSLVRAMPDGEAAAVLNTRLRVLDEVLRTGFMELGYIVIEFQERQLWRHVQNLHTQKPFESLNQWLLEAAPYSRRHCYAAMEIVKELGKDIPESELLGINESNARVLQSVSSAVRRLPEVIQAAKALSGPEFVQRLQEGHPGMHLEQRTSLVFHPSASQAIIIQQALEQAIERMGGTRDDVLESWAANSLMENMG